MNYIEQFESELTKKLEGPEHTATIVEWLSQKVVESYKNGLAAGRKRVTVNRQGKNQSKGSPSKAQ